MSFLGLRSSENFIGLHGNEVKSNGRFESSAKICWCMESLVHRKWFFVLSDVEEGETLKSYSYMKKNELINRYHIVFLFSKRKKYFFCRFWQIGLPKVLNTCNKFPFVFFLLCVSHVCKSELVTTPEEDGSCAKFLFPTRQTAVREISS